LDPKDVEARITKKTKVIMAVHIRGVPSDLDPLSKIAKKHGILWWRTLRSAAAAAITEKKTEDHLGMPTFLQFSVETK